MTVLPFNKVTAAAPLVSLDDAKAHLHEYDAVQEPRITAKLAQATDVVLDYLKSGADPAWTVSTVPKPVQAGILTVLTHLYDGTTTDTDKVWADLDRLLARFRDPALA